MLVALWVMAWIGLLAVCDAVYNPKLPAIMPHWTRPYLLDGSTRPSRPELLAMSDAERFRSMEEALRILDHVCPDVADWTRIKRESGQLVFETPSLGRYAWYMPATGVVGINIDALELSDAELACTLAHEFRHSRQTMLKSVQVGIAQLFGMDRRFELVEAEAYEFEGRVRRAIRGYR